MLCIECCRKCLFLKSGQSRNFCKQENVAFLFFWNNSWLTSETSTGSPTVFLQKAKITANNIANASLHQRTYYWSGHSVTPESRESRISRNRENIVWVNFKRTQRTKPGNFRGISVLLKGSCFLDWTDHQDHNITLRRQGNCPENLESEL